MYRSGYLLIKFCLFSSCWGWDGWMVSPTQWTWVWVNSGSWWWTGRPGVLQFMGSQRVGHDWETELSWTGGLTAQSQTHVNGKASGKRPLCTFSVENKCQFNRHTGTQIQWGQRRRCTWPATETPHWRPERARGQQVPPLMLWSSIRMQYWWARVFLSPDSAGRRKGKRDTLKAWVFTQKTLT